MFSTYRIQVCGCESCEVPTTKSFSISARNAEVALIQAEKKYYVDTGRVPSLSWVI